MVCLNNTDSLFVRLYYLLVTLTACIITNFLQYNQCYVFGENSLEESYLEAYSLLLLFANVLSIKTGVERVKRCPSLGKTVVCISPPNYRK